MIKTIGKLQNLVPAASILSFEIDVTDEKAIDDSMAKTVEEFGRVDYAVNNAGIGGIMKSSDEVPKEDFEKVIATNTTAVWQCQRAQIRQMLKQDKRTDSYRSSRGSIVNVASMYGLVAPPPNIPATAYTASKHAVIGLTKADALAFADKGIRINAISPGYVMTPLVQEHMNKDHNEAEKKKVPVNRYAEIEEIGDCITFLHSDAASYMIGGNMVVDGGYTIA
jgi:NAD(P)-dependent dehydrogenase (short-subunit alcohol dehydrogenase family)